MKKAPIFIQFKITLHLKTQVGAYWLKILCQKCPSQQGIHKSHWEQNRFPLMCPFSVFFNFCLFNCIRQLLFCIELHFLWAHNILYLYLLWRPKASWNVGMKALRVKVRFFSSAGKTTLCNILLVATTFEQICHTGCPILTGSPCSHDLKPKLALQHFFPANFYCIYLV